MYCVSGEYEPIWWLKKISQYQCGHFDRTENLSNGTCRVVPTPMHEIFAVQITTRARTVTDPCWASTCSGFSWGTGALTDSQGRGHNFGSVNLNQISQDLVDPVWFPAGFFTFYGSFVLR
jgi:hypothetical protein